MYNFWYGSNEYIFPRLPHINKDKRTKELALMNFSKGALVGGLVSAIYQSPRSRVLKIALGMGILNMLYSTRGLYCTREFMDRSKPPSKTKIITDLLEEAKERKGVIRDRPREWFDPSLFKKQEEEKGK